MAPAQLSAPITARTHLTAFRYHLSWLEGCWYTSADYGSARCQSQCIKSIPWQHWSPNRWSVQNPSSAIDVPHPTYCHYRECHTPSIVRFDARKVAASIRHLTEDSGPRRCRARRPSWRSDCRSFCGTSPSPHLHRLVPRRKCLVPRPSRLLLCPRRRSIRLSSRSYSL